MSGLCNDERRGSRDSKSRTVVTGRSLSVKAKICVGAAQTKKKYVCKSGLYKLKTRGMILQSRYSRPRKEIRGDIGVGYLPLTVYHL